MGLLCIARCLAEEVISTRAICPVHVAGRTLGGTQMKVGERRPRLVALDHERRGDRVPTPMTGFPHAIVVVYCTPNAPSILLCPQPCGRRVDPGLDRGHLVGVDLRPDRRVDQRADRLGERLIYGAVRSTSSDVTSPMWVNSSTPELEHVSSLVSSWVA
jgi:hypothetical protein